MFHDCDTVCEAGSAVSWDSVVPFSPDAPEKGLLAVHVFIHVKDGCEAAFKAACVANASSSLGERGVARFDVLQEKDDPTKFALIEVYR